METLMEWCKTLSPIFVAIITIVPVIINNRKKTQASLEEFKQEVKTDIKDTQSEVREVKETLAAHIKENEDTTAEEWRVRILRFDDDLCNPSVPYPSEANFQQAKCDVDKYRKYIKKHDDFQNGIGAAAMEHIDDVWELCKHQNLFGKFK